MKKLFIILLGIALLLGVSGTGTAEDVRSEIYEYDLTLTGIAMNGTSTFQVNNTGAYDANSYVDLSKVKPNLGVFSIQLYAMNPCSTCGSSADNSAVTYTLRYTTSNKMGTWSSGTTNIIDAILLSGQTTEVQPFAPELAKYYKFEGVSGVTNWADVRATLIIQ